MVEGIYDRHSYLAGNLVTVCRQPPNFTARTSDGPERKPPYIRKPKKPATTMTTTTTPMM